ncbi:MAG: nucleotidyltransferase domain-containing protein, partial [Eggerthellaceae bacterium]|nr:nucleotidyltransferase domain-containing protein [Eggerthellaceae bacterium]
GLTHTVAINALYSQVVLQQGLPFAVQIPRKRQGLTILDIKRAIGPIAREYGLEKVYVFGSYARGEETPESDIDLHIEPGSAKGFSIGGFQYDAERALERKVDLSTTKSLSSAFRDRIAEEEILLYESKGA